MVCASIGLGDRAEAGESGRMRDRARACAVRPP